VEDPSRSDHGRNSDFAWTVELTAVLFPAVGLPKWTTTVALTRDGASHWAWTARLTTTGLDGKKKEYFLKVARGEAGKRMLQGEHASMNKLWGMTPTVGLVPTPRGLGTCRDAPDLRFFLSKFM
jgi:hypothetical protein